MPLIHILTEPEEQPRIIVPLRSGSTLMNGLAFAVNAGFGPFDSVSGSLAGTWNNSVAATSKGLALAATGSAGETARWQHGPIVGSGGNGTGDVTIAVLANPISEAARGSVLCGQAMNGSPYKQISLNVNWSGYDGSNQAGSVVISGYNGMNQGFVQASSMVDGNFHLFVGVYKGPAGTITGNMYVDGVDRTTSSGNGLGGAGFNDFGFDSTSRATVGSEAHNATDRAANAKIPFAAAWNRALSYPEVLELTNSVWSMWEEDEITLWFSASAPTSFKPAWARNANAIIGMAR